MSKTIKPPLVPVVSDELLSKAAAEEEAEELLERVLSAREKGKQCYAQADEALTELVERLRPIRGKKLLTRESTGEVFELVDQFADRNTVFGHSGVRRFDLKPVKQR
jgi:hypothetical protein